MTDDLEHIGAGRTLDSMVEDLLENLDSADFENLSSEDVENLNQHDLHDLEGLAPEAIARTGSKLLKGGMRKNLMRKFVDGQHCVCTN
jgi:hypothetical protein